MSSSPRFCAVFLLVLFCLPALSHAQSPAKPNAKAPRGTVSGRVTIKEKPAPGVFVGLRKSGAGVTPEPFFKAVTDQEGFYRITNVPPGSYDIYPSAPAYIVSDTNNMRSKNVIVAENEDVEDINFALVRGGVITGKVIDADGRPVIQQQVHLYRVETVQQQARQVFSAGGVSTDDRGIYRFFGLATGRYKVGSGRGEGNFAGSYTANRNAYKLVFHPDQSDHEKATVIDVREGSESTDVDIKLGRTLQTFSVSGRVINGEDGTPAPNIRFGLMRTFGTTYEPSGSVVTNSQGEFTVDAVAPGTYGATIYPYDNQVLKAEEMTFDVIDQDVSGIVVRLTKGLSVGGVVVLEQEDKKAWARLLELKLRGYVSVSSGAGLNQANAGSSISPDGSFHLPGLSPGTLNLWLSGARGDNTPKGFMITRIEHNGVATSGGIEIKEGDHLTGVRVFISYGTATLRGVVNVDAGLVPEGSRTLARLIRTGMPSLNIAVAMVDARGHFLMEGIPAGVYELIVWQTNPGSRTRPASVKQQVTIQDGVVNEVSVTFELPPPKP